MEAWAVSRTANGINVIDENGLPVCTRVGLDDANLIASAPRLADQVRILREALEKIASMTKPGDIDEEASEDSDDPVEVEDWTIDEAYSTGTSCIELARAALEATKEGV